MQYEQLLSMVEEADVIALCQELVRFRSVNPPGDEREIAEYVADILRQAGLAVEVVPSMLNWACRIWRSTNGLVA